MSVAVVEFDGAADDWNSFVRSQRGWTHFHLYGWRNVIQRVYGHETIYLAARDADGALAAVLPLVRVKSVLFGHYLVSLPFVNYGGPLGRADGIRALAGHVRDLAHRDGVKLAELRSRVELPIDLPVSHRKVTVLLDLPDNADALLKHFGAKLRSQIKRPQKEGVEVRFGADQVAPFFQVFAHHMRDLGTPTQSRRLFEACAEEFGDSVWFGCAYLGRAPIACGAGFVWDREFEMTWASALNAYSKIAPNMLVYWAFMQRALEHRLSLFNFGRCSPGSGTHRFKRQWGSRDEALWWYQVAPGGTASTPSPDDGAYAWGPRLWRKLPLGLATAFGPRIVRSIP